ncbi:glnA [Symbiodinium necroappetens]|uniref:GlnA protein n=1 Tax=Symbiodinium necroappetens TaxID=1628268 RepID=A0A813BFW9_9DINO|nr:glnA [Symbiodinium necroappetens]
MKACLPAERLFQGETDGSSFPNGGLRVTHSAAAFTTWDRSSPPFVMDKCLYIPCAFVTHFGKCIDEKTPLLRSMDAVTLHGLRLLKNIGIGTDAKCMFSYLGWEQEFFVLSAAHYKARPDLVNTGRTLFGKLPTRHQQGDLNYFQAIPGSVQELLDNVQAEMLKIGCPMAVKHNEVAPGQHEMSPVFRTANVSCDSNVCFMEVMNREAAKLGLQVLFHEKPFAGINGSGKHANWSIGTDTGMNFFYPGKNEAGAKLYVTAIACLSYGLAQYLGQGFEAFVESICSGGDLLGYKAEKKKQNKHVIFTGNGYSAEWPVEASKRGLPNLNTTPKAIATWASEKNTKLLETLKIYTKEETEARQEVMYENYISCMCCEVETMIQMVETGYLPACAKDLEKFKGFDKLAGSRKTIYDSIVDELEKLKSVIAAKPHSSLAEEATYLCDTVKPQMVALRAKVDKAESVMESSLYPYPTYEAMIYSHHF